MTEPPLSAKIAGLLHYTAETWKVEKLVGLAVALEAEVERLEDVQRQWVRDWAPLEKELAAYRAAARDLRAFLSPFNDGSSDDASAVSEHALAILDKLPKADLEGAE